MPPCDYGHPIVPALFGACTCPAITTVNQQTPSFTLDLDEYTRATWYVQKQQITGYQPADKLFCVTATYNLEPDRHVPFYDGTVVTVYNEATEADLTTGVSGGMVLCARQPDPEHPDRLSVAPCFLPNALSGPYWPLWIETDPAGRYTAVAISGGQPTNVVDGGERSGSWPFAITEQPTSCTTSETGINDAGLWILTREATPDAALVARAEQALEAQGVSTKKMLTVTQGDACASAYASRFQKPRDCADGECMNPTAQPVDDECDGDTGMGDGFTRIQSNWFTKLLCRVRVASGFGGLGP